MIFNTDLNANRNRNYEVAISNLEKARELLDDRYSKNQISDNEYIKKSNEINAQIENYKRLINKEM